MREPKKKEISDNCVKMSQSQSFRQFPHTQPTHHIIAHAHRLALAAINHFAEFYCQRVTLQGNSIESLIMRQHTYPT